MLDLGHGGVGDDPERVSGCCVRVCERQGVAGEGRRFGGQNRLFASSADKSSSTTPFVGSSVYGPQNTSGFGCDRNATGVAVHQGQLSDQLQENAKDSCKVRTKMRG